MDAPAPPVGRPRPLCENPPRQETLLRVANAWDEPHRAWRPMFHTPCRAAAPWSRGPESNRRSLERIGSSWDRSGSGLRLNGFRPSIGASRRCPRQSLLSPDKRAQDSSDDIRSVTFCPTDSSQTQHEIILGAIGELEIEQSERPTFTRILVQGDHIILRAPAVLDVIVPLGPDGPSPRRPKRAARGQKLDFFSRRIDLVERYGIPNVTPAYPIAFPRIALPHLDIP